MPQRDFLPSRDHAGAELGDARALPRLQLPTQQPPKCQTPKCTIHIEQQEARAILGPINLQKQQLSTQTAGGKRTSPRTEGGVCGQNWGIAAGKSGNVLVSSSQAPPWSCGLWG